jgi:hypothetical protein
MADSSPQAAPTRAPPLRVALLFADGGAPRWLVRALTAVLVPGVIHLAGGVSLGGIPLREPRAFGRYLRADWKKHRREPDPLQMVAVGELLGGVPQLDLACPPASPSVVLAPEAVDFLRSVRPDVIISGLPIRINGPVTQVGTYGLWQVCFDVVGGSPVLPDGFWSMVTERPVTTVELRALGETPGSDTVVAAIHTATDVFSLYRGRASRAVTAGAMLRQELERLYATRRLPTRRAQGPPPGAEVVRLPTAFDLASWKVRRFLPRMRQSFLDRLHWLEWSVAYHVAPAARDEPCTDLRLFRVLPSPPGTYQADPCVVLHEGRHFMFMEDYVHAAERGRISVVEFTPDGQPGPIRPVLERPYHLSYPCVFRWNGDWYMVPESMEQGTVELYRATAFPDRWELDRVLLDGVRACDATIHQEGNHWWMFVALADDGNLAIDELHLYRADAPVGPWEAVPSNPIKRDVRGARPAGRLFRAGDRWFRPGQDSALGYGHFIRLFEVKHLGSDGYEEVETGRLGPDPSGGLERVHTISHAGRVTAIDLWRARPRWS